MPNKKGGKKFKRGKKQSFVNKELILKDPEENQEYSKITRINGGGRYQLFCFDGTERLGICAGNIKRKTRFELNNIVLVSLWEFQDTKCSIIHKYDEDEVLKLKSRGEFPSSIKLEEDTMLSDSDELVNFTFDIPTESEDSSDESDSIDLEDI